MPLETAPTHTLQVSATVRQRRRRQRSLPDPPAEGFYSLLGFVGTGEQVPSRVPGGPLFSVYRLRLWLFPTRSETGSANDRVCNIPARITSLDVAGGCSSRCRATCARR